jgi:hypothetical protein
MALITDPDLLNQGTEVVVNAGAKTIALTTAGNLSTDGVTLKALYSFLKEEWKTDANLIKYPFPFVPITDEQFELVSGWNFADFISRTLIRTGGWAVVSPTTGNPTEMWAGVITLGSLEADDAVYYQQISNGSASDFVLTGPVNQAIQVYSDPNGDGNTADGYNYRGFLKLFCRERAQTFATAALTDIGVSQLTYQVYRFPLSSVADNKITASDSAIGNTSPYTGMTITYGAGSTTIGGQTFNYTVTVDGNGSTAQKIYEFIQYKLRQASDIDAGAGSVIGETANELAYFVGDTLYGKPGVRITNFLSSETNNIVLTPTGSSTPMPFPFVAALTLNFGDNLKNDANAIYRVFFTNANGNQYGTSAAIIVNDAYLNPMAGNVGGNSQLVFAFDYDANVQGGRTAGTDADVTVVAIGLSTGQYVKATGTIARSTANTVSLVASLERNYLNP